jgi:hypothetical protein
LHLWQERKAGEREYRNRGVYNIRCRFHLFLPFIIFILYSAFAAADPLKIIFLILCDCLRRRLA